MIKPMNKKGFTLIEILIVVGIIGILSSVVLIGLGPTQRLGRDARRLADLRNVQNALELYFNRCGYYPGGAVQPTQPCGVRSSAPVSWSALNDVMRQSGIVTGRLPADPIPARSYGYGTNSIGTVYFLSAFLEDGNNGALNQDLDAIEAQSLQFVQGFSAIGPSGPAASCDDPVYCITL